ncbi:N-formylglutamate amidohydrolase [Tritonibacter scottomollicae]|uniref:N-formylglutamate amidohydrolase n=1 Tax=Tritonibacter scottomollicae TaxID=483013 RepID=A0ABZ0HGI1_TRISK|nr:N-formylglutamate amidohydrolase [Tritonibacter scottomollicae]WOI32657.1 N-formylglutamate amidohydrolase [Tritonibacter scottomollicae]
MNTDSSAFDFGPSFSTTSSATGAEVIVVCEHAANWIPPGLADLGLEVSARNSHIAWDPGALGVARKLAELLQGPLVEGRISRLVYDLNRPPESPTAIPAASEIFDVPGNQNLSDAARAQRVQAVYEPFCAALADEIHRGKDALRLVVTVHSFTPIYKGESRAVELGLLHGRDDRFAEAMMVRQPETLPWNVRLNEPYSAADGVAHTLDLHGCDNGLLNVMLEIRNDLIATAEQQADWAEQLAPWIRSTLKEAFA